MEHVFHDVLLPSTEIIIRLNAGGYLLCDLRTFDGAIMLSKVTRWTALLANPNNILTWLFTYAKLKIIASAIIITKFELLRSYKNMLVKISD